MLENFRANVLKRINKRVTKQGSLLSRFFLERTGERLCGDKRQTSARLRSVKQRTKEQTV